MNKTQIGVAITREHDKLVDATNRFLHDESMEVMDVFKLTLMDVFRQNYDKWLTQVKPVCRIKKMSFYGVLARILEEAGYGVVSASQIGNYINKVKAERVKGGRDGQA